LAKAAGTHRPERSTVVELERVWLAWPFGAAAQERLGSRDARASRIVERERHAQALRPVAQRRRLILGRCIAAGKRALEQLGPGTQPVADDLLGAGAFLVEMTLDDPARDEREQQQNDNHRRVNAQVQAFHPALALRSVTTAWGRSRWRPVCRP